jgi:gluconokinase
VLRELAERRYGAAADADTIVAAALELAPDGVPFGLCAAMHSLVGLDARDRPVTPLMKWSDPGDAEQAERLRAAHPELHARTGMPLYAMSPLVRLCRLRDDGVTARRWVGVKELVLHRLTGQWVTDHATASGTGLMGLETLDWDPQALELAGVTPDQLPRLVAVTERIGSVAVGGGDGPLANLGLGATEPGVAACSVGTSGALRVTVARPAVAATTFCFAMTPGRWVTGAAVSNGGVVLDWLAATLNRPVEDLLERAAAVPPGSDGVTVEPDLLPERDVAATAGASVRGVQAGHGPGHLTRAALEGVARRLRAVLDAVRDAGHEVREVRATGGLTRSPLFCEILAGALAVPVDVAGTAEASAYGAALLAGADA